MRTSLILTWFVYLADISVLAVKDDDVGIGLSPELKYEIDSYVARVVSALTEKYENRITDLETELGLQKQRISVWEAREHFYESIFATEPTDAENVNDAQHVTTDEVTSYKQQHQERGIHPKATWSRKKLSLALNKHGFWFKRDVERRVAFFASVTNDLHDLGLNQDIQFDNVVTNIGNAYNGHHGTFVAPATGTYVFSATLNSPGKFGHLVVNGDIIAKLHANNGQVSTAVVVQLQPGDYVSVQNPTHARGIYGDKFATFSGFLLYQGFPAGHVIG